MLTEFDNLLRKAVADAIPDDVKKICVWCSGGVDSSTLLYYVQGLGYNVRALHVVFEWGSPTYPLFSGLTSSLKIVASTRLMSLSDHFRLLPQALKQHTGKMGAFPTMLLFMAKESEDYDLILHGLGMDELVGGYRQHAEAVDDVDFLGVEDHYYQALPETNRRTEAQARAMGLAIEAPFINPDLERFCRALPRGLKTEGDRTKIILRDLMRGRIPDPNRLDGLIAGTKGGFHPPIREWWAEGLGAWSNERLSRLDKFRTRRSLWKRIKRANEIEKVALYG
jgi:asparagine synthetase B (glutamine-hydrolysing)